MTPREALRTVATAVKDGRIEFSAHALEDSMPDDGVTVEDILHVLIHGERAIVENDARTKWKVYGPVISGDSYAVVVFFARDKVVIVVTAHYPP